MIDLVAVIFLQGNNEVLKYIIDLAAIYVDKEDHSDCGALLAWAMMMH